MGNLFVYPAPSVSYSDSDGDPSLIYVPQKVEKAFCGFICSESRRGTTKIPCRYIQCQNRVSPYLIIFFHGNSEDIGDYLTSFLSQLSYRFSMNVLCPEYPSYGIYKQKDDSLDMDEAIMQDARTVLKYAQTKLNYNIENIILVGRSLGTGVVCQLASDYKIKGSIVISPYTGIREVAKNLVGTLLGMVVPDVFRSIDYVDMIRSPILFIHGQEDALIPPAMSRQLYDKVKAPKSLTINADMTHNQYRLETDLFNPINTFMLEKLDLRSHLYVRRGVSIDNYIPKEPTLTTEVFGDSCDNSTLDTTFRRKDRPLFGY